MRAVLLCAILFCSSLMTTLYAQSTSPEILERHKQELEQEAIRLRQDELNLIATHRNENLLDVSIRACSRLLALGILVEAGRHMGANPSQAALLIQQDPNAARQRLANAVNKSTSLLESILKSLVLSNDQQQGQILALCSSGGT